MIVSPLKNKISCSILCSPFENNNQKTMAAKAYMYALKAHIKYVNQTLEPGLRRREIWRETTSRNLQERSFVRAELRQKPQSHRNLGFVHKQLMRAMQVMKKEIVQKKDTSSGALGGRNHRICSSAGPNQYQFHFNWKPEINVKLVIQRKTRQGSRLGRCQNKCPPCEAVDSVPLITMSPNSTPKLPPRVFCK